jgi:hypothetical protein
MRPQGAEHAPIIAALDRPKPTGRPRIDARSTPSCSGGAAARARTDNTTEASSYVWWRVEQTMLGVYSAQSGLPSAAPR